MKNKKGFSLAELLIALAVVSVIATIGFSVAQKGIERAFNQYVYTAYSSLYHLFSDAVENDHTVFSTSSDSNYMKHMIKVLQAKQEILNPDSNSHLILIARNNVKYIFQQESVNPTELPDYGFLYTIYVQVPAAKKVKEDGEVRNSVTYKLRYSSKGFTSQIPLPCYISDSEVNQIKTSLGEKYTKNTEFIQKMPERIDLLPFYVDDGLVGRVRIKSDGTPAGFTKRTYTSAKQAHCSVHKYNSDMAKLGYTCSGSGGFGVMKFADPRKVF